MPITIHSASAADIPELVALMREFYGDANYALDEAWASSSFAALLGDSSRGAAWIAREDGVPAGHIVLALRHSMEFGGTDGFIDDLFVRASHRRRGLGGALMDELFRECHRRGVLAVHVETGFDNEAAKALYDRHGLKDRQRLLLTAKLTGRVEAPVDQERGLAPPAPRPS